MKRFSKWTGVIMVLCCFLGLSLPAQAQDMKHRYVVLKGGIYSPQTSELEGFNTGFNGEVAYGHYFDKNWAIEAGTGYIETSARKGEWSGPDSAQTSASLKVVPLTVAIKGSIPVNKFEFYGIGGIGAYYVEADTDTRNDYYEKRHDSDRDTETLFGGFIGLGAIFNVTPKFFFGLEGKYLWTTQSTFLGVDADLKGIQATGNIGFRF